MTINVMYPAIDYFLVYDTTMKLYRFSPLNDDESSETSYYVKPNKPLKINDEPVEYIGIRVPDPYRSQVGCGDFVVNNFDDQSPKQELQ